MNEYKKEYWQRYLENQKYEKYDKEDLIDEIIELKSQTTQLTNNWNELEEYIIEQEEINNGAMKCGLSSGSEIKEMGIQNDIYDLILDKMKEIKENNENS